MYSSQPDESMTIDLESVGVVTIDVLPLHAFGRPAEAFKGSWWMNPQRTVQNVHLQLLASGKFEFLTQLLGNDDLKFRRKPDDFQCSAPIASTAMRSYQFYIDSASVCQQNLSIVAIAIARCITK